MSEERLERMERKLDEYLQECRSSKADLRVADAKILTELVAHQREDDKLFGLQTKAREDGDESLHRRLESIKAAMDADRRRPAVYAGTGTGIGAAIIVGLQVVWEWLTKGGPHNGG